MSILHPWELDQLSNQTTVERAMKEYGRLNPSDLRDWLVLEYPREALLYDPVKAYLEKEYPGLFIQTGYISVTFSFDGEDEGDVAPHDWHDRVLTEVINAWSKLDANERRVTPVQTTVEALWTLLGPRPVSPVIRMLRTVSSAFLRAFNRKP